MPRIRTIKPEFWTDEKMAPMNAVERLTFLGLISMADDMGRLLDNVKIIDAFVFPETDETCREALARLSRAGRIERGRTSSGQAVIQIVNWSKHQKVDRPSFKTCLPEIDHNTPKPTDEKPEKTGKSRQSTNTRESVASDSRERSDRTVDHGPTTVDHGPTTVDHGPTTNDGNEAAAPPSSPPPPAPPAIDLTKLRYPEFPCIKSKSTESNVWALTPDLLERFKETFPAVKIEAECRKAHAWIMANFAKRKTFSGMEDYLRRWLTKEQNRAVSRQSDAQSREQRSKEAGEKFQHGSFANSILP
jgi:hypothetical protein